MADNSLNVSPPFKFEVKTPPRGMTDYDPSAIHPDQQERLNAYKLNLSRENIRYVSSTPEVKATFLYIGRHIWNVKPKSVVREVAKIFDRPEGTLRKEIKKIMMFDSFKIYELEESDAEDWDY